MESVGNKVFVGYCRVSIKGQSESIEMQKEAIQRYADAYSMKISRFYNDDGFSAYTHRPAFEKMMKAVDEYDGIIVADLTRFGRDTFDLLFQIKTLEKQKKQLIFVKQHIDTSSKEGSLLLKMLSAIADYERTQIRERLEAGKEYARAKGTKSGKPMHRPSKTIDWAKFDELKKKGLSVPSIAKVLGVSKSALYNKAKANGRYP
jgi:DNA invertase Pin-like site-specific DNA recombinase